MKILYLYDSMKIGGAQKHIVDLANELAKNEGNTIFIASEKGILCTNLSNKIIFIEIETSFRNPLFFFKTCNVLKNLIRKNKIEIIHSHSRRMNFLVTFLQKSTCLDFRFISTAHNIFKNKHKLSFWSDNTIAVSDEVKDYVNKYNPKVQVTTILNGVLKKQPKYSKNEFKRKIGLEKDTTVITNIGRISEQKNQVDLVEILNIIRIQYSKNFKKIRLLIVGDGDNCVRQDIQNKIKKYKLEENVLLLGERSDIPDILNISNVFCLTSKWEGLPLTILEAMSFGIPTIAYDVGGIRTVTKSGCGEVVSPGHIKDFADRLLITINQIQSGEMTQKKFSEKFNFQNQFNNTLNYYNSLLCTFRSSA